MSKICSSCGAESPDEAKFCRKCGKQSFSNETIESALKINEDDFYEQAWSEVEENKQIKSIWAKAFTQSEGNSEKTKAVYIKLRVDSLKKEAEEKIHLAQKEFKKQSVQKESDNDKAQNKLQNFLKSNAVYISRKISDFEYIVSHQNTPIDSTIKYINEEWRII